MSLKSKRRLFAVSLVFTLLFTVFALTASADETSAPAEETSALSADSGDSGDSAGTSQAEAPLAAAPDDGSVSIPDIPDDNVLISIGEDGVEGDGDDTVSSEILLAEGGANPEDGIPLDDSGETANDMLTTEISESAAEPGVGEEGYQSKMYQTVWALVPPLVAIILALITKEVYISLFIGILTGALFYANFRPIGAVKSIFNVMIGSAGDEWNFGILIFLVILGIIVSLMTKAGGSAAYGDWAARKIKSRKGALLSTSALGVLIFVDDYFNCLTVGSVMRPVTDKFKVSRAKLAYIIDATAAPVCIIAPISSWAAAVSSYAPEGEGLSLFIRTIPYNFYALLTIVMVVAITVMKLDFGPMKRHEYNAETKGDLYTTDARPYDGVSADRPSSKGKVFDLIIPVVVLIISCVAGMVYTGGFFATGDAHVGFVQAFSECDASVGLVLGSFAALLFTFLLYIPRKVVSFKQFAGSIPEGFRAMVPAILILILAWTLGSFCRDSLGAGDFVGQWIESVPVPEFILPAIMFLVALGLAFSTGTSWGTFGILIPICLVALEKADPQILLISISACLAGAVCGDHCSPISDTTIMASSGAQSDHINHVSTQLPYALLVAAVSFVFYIVAGLVKSALITLPLAIAAMVAVLFIIKLIQRNRMPSGGK